MSEKTVSLEVYILDKSYRVACRKGEEDDLLASARLLSDQMRHIREASKVMSHDRVAVMSGLNLAHELLICRRSGGGGEGHVETDRRLSAVNDQLAAALNNATESAV